MRISKPSLTSTTRAHGPDRWRESSPSSPQVIPSIVLVHLILLSPGMPPDVKLCQWDRHTRRRSAEICCCPTHFLTEFSEIDMATLRPRTMTDLGRRAMETRPIVSIVLVSEHSAPPVRPVAICSVRPSLYAWPRRSRMSRMALTFPVLAGQGREDIANEMKSRPREYEESRRRLGSPWREHPAAHAMVDYVTAYLEAEGDVLEAFGKLSSSDLDIDRYMVKAAREIHGADFTQPLPSPLPETVAAWIDPTAKGRGRGMALCAPLSPGATEKARAFVADAYHGTISRRRGRGSTSTRNCSRSSRRRRATSSASTSKATIHGRATPALPPPRTPSICGSRNS